MSEESFVYAERIMEGGKLSPTGAHLNFIGMDPKLRCGLYDYNAVDSFFLEIGVDGQRYRIDVGNIGINMSDGKARRGIHISFPIFAELGELSMNALNLANKGELPLARHKDEWAIAVIKGLMEIAEEAMPDSYFNSDSRTTAARQFLRHAEDDK